MTPAELLVDAFQRIHDAVHDVVGGSGAAVLSQRPQRDAGSIAWLVWHLTRVQDDHLADAAGTEQIWTSDGWAQRFGLPFDPSATGYGQSSQEVAAIRVSSAQLLLDYFDAVHVRTVDWVSSLSETALDRVVDERWDPPVTLSVRLVSVIADDLQHVGQAAYVKGLLSSAG